MLIQPFAKRFLNRSFQKCFSSLSYQKTIFCRQKYLSPSLKTFEAYDTPLVLEKGNMQYVWDSQDKKYIDLLGQNLSISVGHCHPRVVDAAVTQMKKLSHCTTMYYHEEPILYAKELIDTLPSHPSGEDWVVHFVNDGSEAVDLAVQMARVYTGRPEIIGLHKAYHGLHGLAAGLSAIGKATQPSYGYTFPGIAHVQADNIEQLENHITFGTGGKIGGIIIEPQQGYGGVYPLKNGYMKQAFELVTKHGGVTIADEVQTGFCRSGETFWGFEMHNNKVIPDMITIAKGMGNGVGIIGAVICKRSIAEAFTTKMFFNTYGSNPIACAAGREVLRVIKDEKILENCNKQGEIFKKGLTELCNKYPEAYKEVRGVGLFQGLEIYGEHAEKKMSNAYELHKRLLPYGVILGRGSAAGNVFRVQPPMCIQEEDVNQVLDSLDDVGRKWIIEKNG
jgi:alanine-glyoxylate transaminase / (R)-3-amino-2-methylpropionate-pyruvate transaminase